MAAALEQLSSSKMFDGFNLRFRHQSATLGCSMTFSIYMPPSPASNIPVLYWLSGLTCNDENFIMKSGAQRAAAAHGIALVVPDTSPRGLNIEGESDSYDFGVGAGFYLNATNEKWKNWRMYDYVVKELPKAGDADKFLAEQQLLPRNFEEACKAVGAPLTLRMQPGYDHSYYFIATFVDDHIAHHAQFLKSA